MSSPDNDHKLHPRRIFISYGHDAYVSLADRLKDDLIRQGYEVWFDADRIKPGEDWEHYIENGLRWVSEDVKNGRFLLLMTPHSVRRPNGYCLNELARAISSNIKIIPIMLAQCEPPLSICRIQMLDMLDCMPLTERESRYRVKFEMLLDVLEHERLDFEGFHSNLLNALKPLSFEAEIKNCLEHFTGRAWIFKEIEKWLTDPDAQRIFWITGSPGLGKTTISSWLCVHWREVAAFHICRHDNVQKIDPRRCVMSLAYQLSTQLPDYEERLKRIDFKDIDSLDARSLFDTLIVQPLSANFPVPDRTILIVIDGLDEATVNGKNELAGFIASEFERTPEWLRLFVTSRPDPEIVGILQAYTPFNIRIDDLRNEQDIFEFLLQGLGSQANPETIKRITKKCNGLFIYAEWVLRELKYRRLSIDHLEDFPQGLGGIYLNFFERQFPDFNLWSSKVRPALEVIAATQESVQLKVLSSIFHWGTHDERNFKRSLGSLFIIDRGTIYPFHNSVIEWLINEDKDDPYFVSVRDGHGILADYCLKEYHNGIGSWSGPMLKYLPLHLCMAGRWAELEDMLKDLKFLLFEWENDKFTVIKQWTLIEELSSLRMVDVYRTVFNSPDKYDDKDLFVMASLLQNAFRLDESSKIYDYLTQRYRDSSNLTGLQRSISSRALIYIIKSQFDDAMQLLEEQEQICRETRDLDGLQSAMLWQAHILWLRNDFDRSMALLKDQETICREVGNMNSLQDSLSFQALILRVKGSFDSSMALLKEQERICREIGNIDGLERSMLDQGLILRAKGELDEALALLKQQEKLSKKTGNKENLRACLESQALILLWRGDLDSALILYTEEERLSREYGSRFGLAASLCHQAIILRMKGDRKAASALLEATKSICLDIGDKYYLQYSLGQQAIILRLNGDLDGSLSLHKEEEMVCREIGHKRDLAMSLSNQAVIIRMKGDIAGAIRLHDESEQILRELGYKYGLQECLGEKAVTLSANGSIDTALALLKEQEKICHDMGLKLDLARCLENQKPLSIARLKDLECR
jgi:tetratricopeptide (TPR) repeat protein